MRSPLLLAVVGGLFLLDFFVLDPIPYVEEVILFLLTVLVARWKDRRKVPEAEKPPAKTVTPQP